MAREIDASIALGSRIVSAESDKRCFGRNRKRDFDVREQDFIGDSGHSCHENKNRTNSQPVPYEPMRIDAASDPNFEGLGDRAIEFGRLASRFLRTIRRLVLR